MLAKKGDGAQNGRDRQQQQQRHDHGHRIFRQQEIPGRIADRRHHHPEIENSGPGEGWRGRKRRQRIALDQHRGQQHLRRGDCADPGRHLEPAHHIAQPPDHHLAERPAQTARQDQRHAGHLPGQRRRADDGDDADKGDAGAGKLPPCRKFLQHDGGDDGAEHHFGLDQKNGRRRVDHGQAAKAEPVLECRRDQRDQRQAAPVPARQRHEPDKNQRRDTKAHPHQQQRREMR